MDDEKAGDKKPLSTGVQWALFALGAVVLVLAFLLISTMVKATRDKEISAPLLGEVAGIGTL